MYIYLTDSQTCASTSVPPAAHTCRHIAVSLWNDVFIHICVTWLIHTWRETHSCVCHDSFMSVPWLQPLIYRHATLHSHTCTHTQLISVRWPIHKRHDPWICVPWLRFMIHRHVTWSPVPWWHVFTCVLCGYHDRYTSATWLNHVRFITPTRHFPTHHVVPGLRVCRWEGVRVCVCACVCLRVCARAPWLIHQCNMLYLQVRHDSFVCATWLIHTCVMTHSCAQYHVARDSAPGAIG